MDLTRLQSGCWQSCILSGAAKGQSVPLSFPPSEGQPRPLAGGLFCLRSQHWDPNLHRPPHLGTLGSHLDALDLILFAVPLTMKVPSSWVLRLRVGTSLSCSPVEGRRFPREGPDSLRGHRHPWLLSSASNAHSAPCGPWVLGRDLPPSGDLSFLGNCTQKVAFPPPGESWKEKSWKGRVWGGKGAWPP